MYDLRRFFAAQYFACRALVCGLCLAFVSLSATAQTDVSLTYADQISRRFLMESRGNEIWASFRSSSPVMTAPPAPGAPAVPVAVGLSPSAAEIKRYASRNTKYGHIPFTVSQKLTVGKLATGVGALLSIATGGFAGIAISVAAPYLYDWLTDAGLSVDPATGTVGSSAWDGPCVAVTSSWGYRQTTGASCFAAAEAMTAQLKAVPAINIGYVTKCFPSSTPAITVPVCGAGWNDGTGSTGVGYSMSYTGSPSQVITPKTSSEIESALLSKPRTTSEIEKILSETIKYPEIQPDPADLPVIKPPSGNPADKIETPVQRRTETTTKLDGTVETTIRDCKAVGKPVQGSSNKINLVESCSTTVTSTPPGGSPTVVSTSSTEDESASPALKEDSGFCETFVGKLVCADLDTPEAEPIDKTTKTLTYAPENHFGGGACPADQVMTTHNGQSLKVWDWATSCDKINQFFRPLFLTLCAFTALMILAPAVKEA